MSAVTEAALFVKIDSLMTFGLLLGQSASIRWHSTRIDLWLKELEVQLQFSPTLETLKAAWSWLTQASVRRCDKHSLATLPSSGKSCQTKVRYAKVRHLAESQFASNRRLKRMSKKWQASPSTLETSFQIYSHAVVEVAQREHRIQTTDFETAWTLRCTPICSSIALWLCQTIILQVTQTTRLV